jgi:hypothetical protein
MSQIFYFPFFYFQRRSPTLHSRKHFEESRETISRSTMVQLWTLPSALMLLAPQVQGGAGGFTPIESLFKSFPSTTNVKHETNATMVPPLQRGPTSAQREAERHARSERNRERKRRMQEAMKKAKIDPDHVQRVSKKEIEAMGDDHPLLRGLNWYNGGGSSSNAISYADSGQDWAMWQQAYRMLGGFIDCDHDKDGDDSGDDGGDDGDQMGCSRWMMWAAVSSLYLERLRNLL